MIPMMRECTNCLKMLSLTEFRKNTKGKFGVDEQCRYCKREKQNAYGKAVKADPSIRKGRAETTKQDELVRLMSDAKWHAKHEILEICDTVHLRNLRKIGFIIEKRWDAEERGFFYRMVLE